MIVFDYHQLSSTIMCRLTRALSSEIKIFYLRNEARRANLNANKRIFKWELFWNKVYTVTGLLEGSVPSYAVQLSHASICYLERIFQDFHTSIQSTN